MSADIHIVKEVRCWRCDRKLAENQALPYDLRCQRCHARNRNAPICPHCGEELDKL